MIIMGLNGDLVFKWKVCVLMEIWRSNEDLVVKLRFGG